MRMFWVLSSWFRIAGVALKKSALTIPVRDLGIIADMVNAGIDNAEGVTFSVPRKSEMASLMKQRMSNRQFFYPLLNWERPYRGDVCTELNVERYDLRKDGNIGFSHPGGTHDDVFWSVALAIYGTVEMQPEQFVVAIPR